MRRIAVINQKGGVGKTTTTVNLGAALARLGYRTLVCDLDPQCNLTVHLDNATGARTFSAFFALLACELLVLMRRRSPWLDYLRLGFIYAVVLEAFKVGS